MSVKVRLTESQAQALGPVDIYEGDVILVKTAFAGGAGRSYMKLVVDGLNERVLDVHIIGDDAPDIRRRHPAGRALPIHPSALRALARLAVRWCAAHSPDLPPSAHGCAGH